MGGKEKIVGKIRCSFAGDPFVNILFDRIAYCIVVVLGFYLVFVRRNRLLTFQK